MGSVLPAVMLQYVKSHTASLGPACQFFSSSEIFCPYHQAVVDMLPWPLDSFGITGVTEDSGWKESEHVTVRREGEGSCLGTLRAQKPVILSVSLWCDHTQLKGWRRRSVTHHLAQRVTGWIRPPSNISMALVTDFHTHTSDQVLRVTEWPQTHKKKYFQWNAHCCTSSHHY